MAKEHTAIRLEPGDLARADALIPRMATPGLDLKRSNVLTMAIARGLDALEGEHGKDDGSRLARGGGQGRKASK